MKSVCPPLAADRGFSLDQWGVSAPKVGAGLRHKVGAAKAAARRPREARWRRTVPLRRDSQRRRNRQDCNRCRGRARRRSASQRLHVGRAPASEQATHRRPALTPAPRDPGSNGGDGDASSKPGDSDYERQIPPTPRTRKRTEAGRFDYHRDIGGRGSRRPEAQPYAPPAGTRPLSGKLGPSPVRKHACASVAGE